jgi:formylglycine-generating enzyme required for sulfatase activity
LPTEAEWEYACRAGTVTSRYYGESEELLGNYAWYVKNSGTLTRPMGSKKPNDLGLFDMHGNVQNWCQENEKHYPVNQGVVTEDREGELSIVYTKERVTRGGSFRDEADLLRSASRVGVVPTDLHNNFGFRPARTITP